MPLDDLGDRGFDRSELERVAARWSLSFDGQEPDEILEALNGVRATYERVDAIARASLPSAGSVTRPRIRRGEDPYNAWLWQFDAVETGRGSLSGRRLAIKDCIAVEGVPMTLGGNLLQGHVPAADATVVSRARAAGATLVGTATCEDMCTSGSSFTSVTGPVRNPYDLERSSGGSSSGCAVLVAIGAADLALGTDQGGSVRNPAAWSGICGLKPTFGLVPYSGAFPFEFTLDHVGLMARDATDVAALLDVVAGPTDNDHRQIRMPTPRPFGETMATPLSGVRIGVVREGFGWPGVSDAEQDEVVRRAINDLASLGADVREVSIPLHRHANDIHVPIATEGSLATVFEQHSQGSNRLGFYDGELAGDFGRAVRARAGQLSLNAKISLIAGTVLRDRTASSVLAKAQNLRSLLRRQYDKALEEVDILAMPAVPMPAHRLPTGRLPAAEHNRISFEMHCNNCAQNLTGHPAMSVPCGLVSGLPVGMLLVGRHLDEHTVLRVAHQYQVNIYPCPVPPTHV